MQLNHGSYIAVVVAEVRWGGVVNLTIQFVTTHNPIPLGSLGQMGLRMYLRLCARQQGARHPSHPRMARAPVDHEHRSRYGFGAE